MSVQSIGTYEPAWQRRGARVAGFDEDVTTMAVAAGLATLKATQGAPVQRVIVVARQPDVLEGSAGGVLALGLGLDEHLAVEQRLGGAVAMVDALCAAPAGTLVIGVDAEAPAGAAGAVISADAGATIVAAGRVGHSLPIRVRRIDRPALFAYDDRRLERDRGWLPSLNRLAGDASIVVGPPAKDAAKLGAPGSGEGPNGAAGPLFAVARLAVAGREARIVALDAGEAAAMDVLGASRVELRREVSPGVDAANGPAETVFPAEIPISLPAYERALVSKLGMVGARCECGEVSFPPRIVCLVCSREYATSPEPLPRTGEVYSAVTVHAPVPGLPGPYELAIVSLDGLLLRVLAHVTDAPMSGLEIGSRGELVFRRVAIREGVPDYGFGFRPTARPVEAMA